MPYVLDTNVFLQAKNLHYGFDFCPGFWDWLKESNQRGTVFSIEKVRTELVDDDAAEWADRYGDEFFLRPDTGVGKALATVSQWVTGQGYEVGAVNTFLQVADYYLVAQALAVGYTVVTHEVPANSVKKIEIPNACIGLGVTCMNPFEMLRVERARLVLGK